MDMVRLLLDSEALSRAHADDVSDRRVVVARVECIIE